MTHFQVLVILPPDSDDPEAGVAELLAPYDENGEWFADGSRWDWWVIGGRWDGEIRGLVWEPVMQTCFLCQGTGTRTDPIVEKMSETEREHFVLTMNGCNGCHGTGMAEAWPTHEGYRSLERNLCTVAEIKQETPPLAFVTPDGVWHETERMGWWGMTIPTENGDAPVAEYDQAWAVVRDTMQSHLVVSVDCHV